MSATLSSEASNPLNPRLILPGLDIPIHFYMVVLSAAIGNVSAADDRPGSGDGLCGGKDSSPSASGDAEQKNV